MLKRCLQLLAFASGVFAAPADAATIKCKIEESNTVFHIEETPGGKANVKIGTLSSAPKLVFKGVAMRTAAAGGVEIEATPAQMVGTSGKLKCADLRKRFSLTLAKRGATTYAGDLLVSSRFDSGSDRRGGCKGFAAPELQDDFFKGVVCLKSNQ